MKLQPMITLECDHCGFVQDFEMTALARDCYDDRGLQRESERCGWVWVDEDIHECEQCVTCPDCGELEGDCTCKCYYCEEPLNSKGECEVCDEESDS